MSIVACLTPVPSLIAPAAARGLALRPLAEAPDAIVRLARWRQGDGCIARRLGDARGGNGAARAMLLVDDGDALAAGLEAGADDAATIAASPVEIVARLAALLRAGATTRHSRIGDLTIDRLAQRVCRADRAIPLLPREYAVLLHLADHAGQTVSRAALLRGVWAREFDPGTNVVQVQISRLRAKLDAAGPPLIHTDRGGGYRLSAGDRLTG
ncbi:response regulator transcription factor [Sphingomonas sp. VNH70]|uniref:winged helix-turn-helix domain-containing protein n=1 Tax=Sphingomonas silueang TaxID=3156617 RepID=UPI0032B372C7